MRMFKRAIVDNIEAINRASKIVGSEKALAEIVGVSRQRLNYWKLNGLLPCNIAMDIYVATGGQVGMHELCPDLKLTVQKFITLFIARQKIEGLYENKLNTIHTLK
ncbi:MAG: hypothetical protein ACD_69C00353G0003 [uncultured bacterium]|nr:MAG: hypothetical protein ACD_69C00353G0003 [uncultured bacterium]